MSAQDELVRCRRLLNVAETEIKEGRPGAALELLKPVISILESREGTLEWAELPLVTGYALTAKKDSGALAYLNDALERIRQLHDPPTELRIRVYKHLGNFHRLCERRRATAREFYIKAKELADAAGFAEDSAKMQMRINGIDLENDGDPLCADFLTLVGVGRREGFTATEQLAVWRSYQVEVAKTCKMLKAARGLGAAQEKFFLNRLRSQRNEKTAK